MPGAFAFLDNIDPNVVTEAPETIKLWLPSQLPPNSHNRSCIEGLLNLKLRLRLAQAHDALDLIQHLRGVYQVLLVKNKVHISSSQGTTTRTKALFTNFALKINQVAARYRNARIALFHLDPNKEFSQWKEDLKELRQEDLRGPSREDGEPLESCQQISWIWQTLSQGNAGINDPDLQDIMRVEWCKAIARAD